MARDYVQEFAVFLVKAHGHTKKTALEISKELKIDPSSIAHWENCMSLPSKARLSDIAKVYQINLTDLEIVFNLASNQRSTQKTTRKHLKKKKRETTTDKTFPGEIESTKDIGRTNWVGWGGHKS